MHTLTGTQRSFFSIVCCFSGVKNCLMASASGCLLIAINARQSLFPRSSFLDASSSFWGWCSLSGNEPCEVFGIRTFPEQWYKSLVSILFSVSLAYINYTAHQFLSKANASACMYAYHTLSSASNNSWFGEESGFLVRLVGQHFITPTIESVNAR